MLLPLKLLKKLARRINGLPSVFIVIKGLNRAMQQVIVAGNTNENEEVIVAVNAIYAIA